MNTNIFQKKKTESLLLTLFVKQPAAFQLQAFIVKQINISLKFFFRVQFNFHKHLIPYELNAPSKEHFARVSI